MSIEGIFINGVFSTVVCDILNVQASVPDQVLYLQPFSGGRIAKLSKNPPSLDQPVRLFLSLTGDLSTVSHTCEIVGWNDKREFAGRRREIIEKVIGLFQPTEGGVYSRPQGEEGSECVNLLHVRRMRQLSKPFSVGELIKLGDDQPLSTNRTRAGGWVYVKFSTQEWLESSY
jgi:hypothetical protein